MKQCIRQCVPSAFDEFCALRFRSFRPWPRFALPYSHALLIISSTTEESYQLADRPCGPNHLLILQMLVFMACELRTHFDCCSDSVPVQIAPPKRDLHRRGAAFIVSSAAQLRK